MSESQIGKFEFKERGKARGKKGLTITVFPRSSLFIGNPKEDQYIRLFLTSFRSGIAKFDVFEKISSEENEIGGVEMGENIQYKLQGANLFCNWRKFNGEGKSKIIMNFDAPKNVDIIRSSQMN